MKIINKMTLAAVAAGTLFCCSIASAIPIELAPSPINTNPGGQGAATVDAWLASVVTSYNTLNSTSLPAPGAELFRVNQGDPAHGGIPSFGSGIGSIVLPETYLYIVLHWGGGNANDVAYYTGNDSSASSFNFVNTLFLNDNGQPLGLSSVTVYGERTTRVPDGGSTMSLLGLGLAGISLLRRKMK